MGEKYIEKTDKIYKTTEIFSDDEFESICKAISVVSFHWFLKGESSMILRPQCVSLLAVYIKYGYNSKAKKKACDILNKGDDEKTMSLLNSLNFDLRRKGVLIMDKMNKRISHLHPDFENLRNYVIDDSLSSFFFLFKLTK